MEILQFRGSTGLYLDPSPGKASLNLIKMAHPDIALELRNIIHKVTKTNEAVKKSGIAINKNGSQRNISLEALPINSENDERIFLIIFEEVATPVSSGAALQISKNKLVNQLQSELLSLRDDMRAIVEDQEASNEELQSANEEIVSSNEELQSMNEELETSKEEMESTNEELMTINQELQTRNDQLTESYEYSESVLSTIREAVLVLDKNMRVRAGNFSFYQLFRLKESETEGRLLFEVGKGELNIPLLRSFIEKSCWRRKACRGVGINTLFRGNWRKNAFNKCEKDRSENS